ncbi:MAG: hypothetical protein E7812_07885 [Phenylobacterium sp.]|nr:MAG: hypothetical protein E7812_07885 [Phenylobacterium sp.]
MDNPHDPGGVTAYGVSLRYALETAKIRPEFRGFLDVDHDGTIDRRDIAGLTADAAADIYFNGWWKPGWYGGLTPALVAWKCFDIAVNTGPRRAAVLLQSALCWIGVPLKIDGEVGPATLDAVQAQAERDQGASLMAALRTEQADFYRRLAATGPKLAVFLPGWLNRAAA